MPHDGDLAPLAFHSVRSAGLDRLSVRLSFLEKCPPPVVDREGIREGGWAVDVNLVRRDLGAGETPP